MKYIVLLLFTLIFYTKNIEREQKELFKVSKIDSINNYYKILLIKKQKKYLLISQKSKKCNLKPANKKILLNEVYSFNLESAFGNNKNRNKPIFTNSLLVNCISLDEKTSICKDSDIVGIFFSKNIKGLYYVSK